MRYVTHVGQPNNPDLTVYDGAMPEGPELARSRDRLKQILEGRAIVNAFCGKTGRYKDEPPTGFDDLIAGIQRAGAPRVKEVAVKGKFMWWRCNFPCEHDDWYLWITYGMSGQWSTKETKHSGFGIYHNDSGLGFNPFDALYFNDPRHFGTLKFVKGTEVHAKKLASLGPDMLNDPPDTDLFRQRLRQHNNKTLAEALMNQGCVSGVGNYIKAEALYLAELSPHREVSSCSDTDLEHLRRQIINVMKASYNNDGATIRSYLNVDGTKGGQQSRFLVYGNQTDPLGNPVVREETKDGRTTHWVPSTQR